MLGNITVGQYFPGNSLLHRLDPRLKIVLLFLMLIGVFLLEKPAAYAFFTAVTVLFVVISRVPLRTFVRALKPLWWIVLFTFVIHLLTTPGREIFHAGILTISEEGLTKGCLISLRLVLLIVLSSLLTFTTSPLKLTDGMDALLSPGKRFGLPAHELAMMMTIALRFIPTLIEETDTIIKAQESRGADFTTGNMFVRLKNMLPILVPLFLSSFRRADELALAMEARCYRGGEGRTQMKELRFATWDGAAVLLFLLFTVAAFLLNHYL